MITLTKDKKIIGEIVYEILESFPEGMEFTGRDLKKAVDRRIRGSDVFHDTPLRYVRYYRANAAGLQPVNIDRKRSLYKILPRKAEGGDMEVGGAKKPAKKKAPKKAVKKPAKKK